jgi:hypothetical protein
MSEKVQLGRNPFSRTTLVRECVPAGARQACQWCGLPGAKFSYSVEDDSGRSRPLRGVFCNGGCLRAFHDLNQ